MPQPTVAIIGASADRRKFGNKAVRAYAARGYEVYPIHPTASQIEGHKAYRSVVDVPVKRLDRVSLYVPSTIGVMLLEEVACKGANEVWVNPGAESDELLERARQLGLNTIVACSIVGVGVVPGDLD